MLNGTNSENDLSVPNCHYQVMLLLSVECWAIFYLFLFQGVVLGKSLSKVAVSICNGDHIDGEVFDGTDVYGLTYYDGQYVTRYPQEAGNSSNGVMPRCPFVKKK